MPSTRTLELPAGTIRYRDAGQGEPIVFVHGLLVDGLLWRDVAARLEDRYRCIVPNWPLGSHSEPMAPDADLSPRGVARLIADALAALELEKVTLVANDTGGAIAQLLVTEHPERIGRLVLTPCDAFENFLPPMFRYLQVLARIPGGIRALLQPMRLRGPRQLPFAYGRLAKHGLDPAIVDQWVAPALSNRGVRRDLGKLLRGISSRDTLAAAQRLSGFNRPTLIAWAPEERSFPVDHGRRLAAIIPDARLAMIEDAWVFVSEDQPARLAELIDEFVCQAPIRGADRLPAISDQSPSAA